jgi:hypothetical protein
VLHRPRVAPNTFDGSGLVAVARTRVAWVTSTGCTVCGGGGPYASVHTKDLRGGRGHSLVAVRDHDENDLYGDAVDALAVDTCGRVAYRSVAAAISQTVAPGPQLTVWTAGGRRTIDSGDIDRHSVRIQADLVRWTRVGQDFTAPVGGFCF